MRSEERTQKCKIHLDRRHDQSSERHFGGPSQDRRKDGAQARVLDAGLSEAPTTIASVAQRQEAEPKIGPQRLSLEQQATEPAALG